MNNRSLRLLSLLAALLLICVCVASCSKNKNSDDATPPSVPEITAPADVYLVSLYSYTSGGISYYDYDPDGRLLSVNPIDPYTMQPSAEDTYAIAYTYSSDGRLESLKYFGLEMTIEYSDSGALEGAVYSGDDMTLEIEFECDENGRIKKETVYDNGELFCVNEYGEIGMLVKETMPLAGEATYIYTEEYNEAQCELLYGEAVTIRLEKGEGELPSLMTLASANQTQSYTWEYGENGLCSVYTEKTDNSVMKYHNKYNSENKRIETSVYYRSLSEPEYLMQKLEYSYDGDDLIYASDSSFFSDGVLWQRRYNEYENGCCTKSVDEEYTDGVLSGKTEIITEYNDKGEVLNSQSTEYGTDGTVQKRIVDTVEYDADGRMSKITTRNYGKGDVYEEMLVEEYEYLDGGSYKIKTSIYDAEGKLTDQTEDIIEAE